MKKLKNKLGESEARDLLAFVNTRIEQAVQTSSERVMAMKTKTENRIAEVKKEYITREILKAELKAELAEQKADILKPSFAFTISTIGIILAGMFAMFKLFLP